MSSDSFKELCYLQTILSKIMYLYKKKKEFGIK